MKIVSMTALALLAASSLATAQTAGTAPGDQSGSSRNTPRTGEPNIARDPEAKPRTNDGSAGTSSGTTSSGTTSGPGGSAGTGPSASSPTTGTGGDRR